jgi:hypothetical protein
LCNILNGLIYSELCFLKICSDRHNHSSDGIDNSYVATDIDDIIMPVATILI